MSLSTQTDFPSRLRDWREHNNFTQEEAGNILGISGRYVGMLERGEKDTDTNSSLYKLFCLTEKSGCKEEGATSPVSYASSHSAPSAQRLREDAADHSELQSISHSTGIPVKALLDIIIAKAVAEFQATGQISLQSRHREVSGASVSDASSSNSLVIKSGGNVGSIRQSRDSEE